MTDFFAPFRALPQAFIDLGALVPISLIRETGTFDPKAMSKASGTTTINGHGVLSLRKTKADNGAIITATIAKLTVQPLIGDKLHIASQIFTVAEVNTVQPDGTPIIFEAVLS